MIRSTFLIERVTRPTAFDQMSLTGALPRLGLLRGRLKSAQTLNGFGFHTSVYFPLCSYSRSWTFGWVQRCGFKAKSAMSVSDLPQGLLNSRGSSEDPVVEEPVYPTVLQQARNNMRKFENCVLLTRVGGFYELYFEHAEEYGPLLSLKVGSKRTSVGSVAMAGFPFFQLERFLRVLVQDLHKSVAISEEYPNPVTGQAKSGGLLFDRRVARVITPGTLVDEKFLDPYLNNFLLALHPMESGPIPRMALETDVIEPALKYTDSCRIIGLAWLDLSTGEFFTQGTTLAQLASCLERIGAAEIVISDDIDFRMKEICIRLLSTTNAHVVWLPLNSKESRISKWSTMLESPMGEIETAKFTPAELAAGSTVLSYVRDRLQGMDLKLQKPIKRQVDENMSIDKNTMRGLELLESSKYAITGGKGSLLHTIRRTVTKSGARLLRQRIASPSTSIVTINARLDLAEQLLEQPELRTQITSFLSHTVDSQKVVQKFSLGRGDADDLLDLHRTITATERIIHIIKNALSNNDPEEFNSLDSRKALVEILGRFSMSGPDEVAKKISQSIDEEGLLSRHRQEDIDKTAMMNLTQDVLRCEQLQGEVPSHLQPFRPNSATQSAAELPLAESKTWIMKRNASAALVKLHRSMDILMGEKADLELALRNKLGANSLKLRWTPALGHFCHVKGAKDLRAYQEKLSSAKNIGLSKSTRSFYINEWSTLGARIDQAREQIAREESQIFQSLRELVVKNLVSLRRNAGLLDELDVGCSSAILAVEQRLVRPGVNDSKRHHIVAGRHPCVKIGLEERGRLFVANDCFVGEEQRIWLITGPNMSGKSTFLRQNALISVMAQIGYYVPAENAEIGIVDQIFSRIGAADDLYHDQSTFMVEMLETASILRMATPRSFVIMDEIGRGTTPEDGVAVGFACLYHLYTINRCRTLFSTHFHKLVDLTGDWKHVRSLCNDIEERDDGAFNFVHRLRPGVNRRSHALKVAQLAGLPEAAISAAAELLQKNNQTES